MSQINFSFDSHAQDVDCDQTSLVVAASSLMSHPTTTSCINKNTTNSSSSSSYTLTTTHSIKTSNNNNDNADHHNNSNTDTAVYKRSLNNPALVKRKQYSKKSYKLLKAMKYCNNSLLGIAIASLSVVFYIIGAIFFAIQLVQLKDSLYESIILQKIFLITCLVMSVASSLLIFGIVKQRHLLMIPWLILTLIGIICDIIYLIVLYTGSEVYRVKELITYLVGIGLQTFIFINIYRLYKNFKWKFSLRQEHKVIWGTHQVLMEHQ